VLCTSGTAAICRGGLGDGVDAMEVVELLNGVIEYLNERCRCALVRVADVRGAHFVEVRVPCFRCVVHDDPRVGGFFVISFSFVVTAFIVKVFAIRGLAMIICFNFGTAISIIYNSERQS